MWFFSKTVLTGVIEAGGISRPCLARSLQYDIVSPIYRFREPADEKRALADSFHTCVKMQNWEGVSGR